MSLAARHMEDATVTHLESAMAAHRAWAAEQERIALHYEQLVTEAAAWRVEAMADADSRYRAAHGQATAQLVNQLPQPIRLAIESGGQH